MDALSQLNTALSGRYEVGREIGAGGMATVFLARDVKHDRSVALKVLKPELGAVLGVERFLSEIRVTANLQHPNLLPLFDSGEANGLLFYVMPFVDGESLRARLEREKQLPVDDALHIATAVANALDYAHRNGVIHRDLKPENILLQDGQPVIADFGIALAVSKAAGSRITQTGLSLGTPQYMSPEQAAGDRTIDGRTDIYSLAAVTYEMLAGDPPHLGSTAQAIIARVLTEKPRSVRANRPSVPEYVAAALDRALEKLPADRFATAREFASALGADDAGRNAATSARNARFALAPRKENLRRSAKGVALAAIVAAAAWGWLRPNSGAVVQRGRFVLTFPDSFRLREDLAGQNVAISPDGTQLVYTGGEGQGQLYVRPIDELEPHVIRGTERASSPRFSPDGKWVAFVVDTKLKKIAMTGGPAITIADTVNRASWGDDDQIVFERGGGSRSTGLWRVSAGGGAPVQITTIDRARRESSHTWPFVLPGGTAAVFTIERSGNVQASELAAVRIADGKVIRLRLHGVNPRYISPGYLLFGRFDGTLAAAPFDAQTLRVQGPPVTVLENVFVKNGGATEVAVAQNGTLVFTEGVALRQIVLINRDGTARVLPAPPGHYEDPQFAPTGDRLAVQLSEPASSKTDIWVYSITLGTMTRLTRDGQSGSPVWSADGRRIAWTFGDDTTHEIRWQPADGSGEAQTLFDANQRDWAITFSPAGRLVAAVHSDDGTQSELFLAAIDSTASARPLVRTTHDAFTPRFSPDGRWLAYGSGGISDIEVYVTAVSGKGGRFQISTAGGFEPVWAPDGRTLYFRTASRMMAASVATSPTFVVTHRDSLFSDPYVNGFFEHSYDIAPDGKSFLMLRGANREERAIVVFDWLHELRERMALAARK